MPDVTATAVPNFASVLREREIALIKSNLENLASAHVMIGEDIIRLEQRISKMKTLQAEIVKLGEKDPTALHVSDVKTLYDRAMKNRS